MPGLFGVTQGNLILLTQIKGHKKAQTLNKNVLIERLYQCNFLATPLNTIINTLSLTNINYCKICTFRCLTMHSLHKISITSVWWVSRNIMGIFIAIVKTLYVLHVYALIITLQCDILTLVWLFGPANVTFWTCQCDFSALRLLPFSDPPPELKNIEID